ncbi:phage tail protein, partial [Glaesserella parasuis]|nr:phage tail protein [Glaesserella parasuis]
ACNRIGISGDRIRFQTANNLNAWGNTIELANLSDFIYQKIDNFEIRKYPDGTMIQTFTKRMTNSDYSTSTVLWAQSFITRPILSGIARYEDSIGDHDSIVTFVKGTDHAKCVFVKGETYNNHNELAYVDVIAIGRWK